MLAARPIADVEDLLWIHRQGLGRSLELGLLVLVSPSLPGNQDAVVVEQRRRQLGEGREATDSASGHCVVGSAPGGGGRLDRSAHEVALAPYRLDQVNLGIGQGYSED